MAANFCPKCDGWLSSVLSVDHTCPPTWSVWCPEDGTAEEHAVTVHAYDEDDAAEEFAKKECEGDPAYYDVYINGGKDLTVKNPHTGEVHHKHVFGEATVDFHVREKA